MTVYAVRVFAHDGQTTIDMALYRSFDNAKAHAQRIEDNPDAMALLGIDSAEVIERTVED